jgi:FixJ family two-component response regulator
MAAGTATSSPLYRIESVEDVIKATIRQVTSPAVRDHMWQAWQEALSGKQIARHLGVSVRTIEDYFSAMRQQTGTHSRGELIAYAVAAGLVKPGRIGR